MFIEIWVSVCLRYQNEGQAGAKIFDAMDHFLEEFLQLIDQRFDLEPLEWGQFGCERVRTTARATALSYRNGNTPFALPGLDRVGEFSSPLIQPLLDH